MDFPASDLLNMLAFATIFIGIFGGAGVLITQAAKWIRRHHDRLR